ncbi:amino acid ABC transporter permease [Rhodophyticola sp. CCM32]|nr:amino acid ABC transporter permease [Rhodophyticola sp. CCM32]
MPWLCSTGAGGCYDPAPGPSDRDFPWWLLAVLGLGAYALWQVLTDAVYLQVLDTLRRGVLITIFVTLVGFALAASLGLLLALASLSRHLILRQMARFYIEIIRGIPIIVLLLYVAFVFAPALVAGYNGLAEMAGVEAIRTRDFPLLWRAIIALAIGYSAFIAEVFRAGLQSIDRGQIEAAEALGLNRWNRFRHIIFPQAIRTILPPLGNDFVAMVKDSSLVSVLGVLDITQLGKVTAASNFRYFETYNVVALIYLTMTITLSILLRRLEQRMRQSQDR